MKANPERVMYGLNQLVFSIESQLSPWRCLIRTMFLKQNLFKTEITQLFGVLGRPRNALRAAERTESESCGLSPENLLGWSCDFAIKMHQNVSDSMLSQHSRR